VIHNPRMTSSTTSIYSYRLTAWHNRRARFIGKTNASGGVRYSLELVDQLINAGLIRPDRRLAPELQALLLAREMK
jgi:hypothetical protein